MAEIYRIGSDDLVDRVSTFGGTNLIKKSNSFRTGSVQSTTTMVQTVENSIYKMVISAGNSSNWNSSWWATGFANDTGDLNNVLITGQQYTVSMTMKAEGNTKPPTLYLNSTNGYKQLQGTLSNNWSIVYYNFIWAANGTGSPHLGWSAITTASTYWIKNWKIEIGNKPTDWTPAPQDLVTYDSSSESLVFFQ